MEIDLAKLEDSKTLLDTLIDCENVLDSLDVYVYRNWFNGEIVEGPIVSRYWVKMSLLYPFDKMPDPRAALRLLKHGVQVEFDRMQRAAPEVIPGQQVEKKPDEWLVRLSFPRRLLDQNEEADLEVYDDEINPDDVTDAKDTGMDDESSLHADEQAPGGDMQPVADPAMAPPPEQPQQPPPAR
jgi:hypothetical protein